MEKTLVKFLKYRYPYNVGDTVEIPTFKAEKLKLDSAVEYVNEEIEKKHKKSNKSMLNRETVDTKEDKVLDETVEEQIDTKEE